MKNIEEFLGIAVDTPIVIASVIFAIAFGLQLYFLLKFYLKITFSGKNIDYANPMPVSVVICAKNEAENLEKNLPLILEQQHPDYEVIVVNDCSSDSTGDVLQAFKQKYSNLRVTEILEDERFSHGKKLALSVGIKAAKNELLLLTDADCYPESKEWVTNMQQNFVKGKQIVLGYGGFIVGPGFLNKFIRYDGMFIAMQYFTFALAGRPYMGVGRNLAYRKSLFLDSNNFASHIHLPSGDDDLFINQVATSDNVRTELRATSHTRTWAKKSYDEWIHQKKRHFATWSYYKQSHKLLLGSEQLSRVLFYLLFVMLATAGSLHLMEIAGALVVIRSTLFLISIKFAMKRLLEKDFLLISLFFDMVLPFINFYITLSNKFQVKRSRWK